MAIVNKTFEEFAQKPASKKSILAHLEPTQKLVTWAIDSGAVYKKTVSHYVINIFKDTTEFIQGTSAVLNAGEFWFDYSDKTLYLRMDDDSNPELSFIVAQYRLFFADSGYVLSYDLTDAGNEVEYEGIIASTSSFKQELDNAELLGISLESDGSIKFNNKSGYWDSIFDTLFWDNKSVRIYSWFPDTPFSESRLIFEGEIENKSYTSSKVSFKIKDFIYKLRQPVSMELFSEADGTISEDVSGVKFKRRLYGQTNGVKLQSLDQSLERVPLAGTISGSSLKQVFVNGTGTLFSSELAIGNLIKISNREYEVVSIPSNTLIEIKSSDPISDKIENQTFEKVDLVTLSGGISATVLTLSVLGLGTLFTSELTTADKFRVGNFDYEIDSITNDTNLIVDNTIQTTLINQPFKKIVETTLTGTISIDPVSRIITGVGTDFLNDTSPDDEIIVETALESFAYKIESVESETLLTISDDVEKKFSGVSVLLKPEIPLRSKNRELFVAGHKLREPTTTVTAGLQLNRFKMNTTDFFTNDIIIVGTESVRIKRITDDVIILFQNLDDFPVIGTTVTKNPIRAAYFNQKELIIDRDFTVQNTATDCRITLTDLAEFNIVRPQKLQGQTAFTSGLRTVTGSGFDANLKPRDWIQSGEDITHKIWYEILHVVSDTLLILRVPYGGLTILANAKKRNIKYVDDESVVTVDCIGKEDSTGKWVKTASDVVLDLIQNDALITNIDLASFAEAKIDNDYIMSLKLPLQPDDDEPESIRDTISRINKSIFGSLVAKTDFQISYNILTPDKPENLEEIKDDDLIGGAEDNFSVSTKSDVRRKITVRYNHFDADRFTGGKGNDSKEFENPFVDNLIGTKKEKTIDVYLFNELNAQTVAERYALIHSLTQNIVRIKAKLNLTLRNLNDKIYINFARLFDRFGGSSETRKIGIISRIARGSTETVVSFSDLSNQFNRVGNVANDSSADFTTAPDNEKILNGYIVDDNTEIPDSSDEQWNTNLIG